MTISWREAWRFWFKLGFISFGGPAGQIALMHAELVERRRWISEQRFLHALNYCMLLPGPEAQQLATYLGWLMHRTWGGIVAGVLFVLPSWFILVVLSYVYVRWGEVSHVAAVFAGIQPAVTAVVALAALRLARRTLKQTWLAVLALLSFLALTLAQVDFPLIVLVAAISGWCVWYWRPDDLMNPSTHAPATTREDRVTVHSSPYLIDDASPLPEHARWNLRHALVVVCAGLLLALAPLAAMALCWGADHVLTQMGWFFTQAALVTFGGAYAVLPYVQQAAVDTHGWLTATQMIDGMALGETTPGPLIMVVAFVGFLGGWSQQALGPDAALLGAILASAVATYFTFLPSFVFILAGGPWVEATRGRLSWAAPLQAISAAVVGVMAHLAWFFAQNSLWPQGGEGWPKPMALAWMLLALALMVRWRWSVASTLLACGALGWLAHAVGWAL
ncbi:MAG: chromate efflux transporter [Alphaproteobacteria bacterium]|nr:chromate efflux transporter [Alphaproteobacteria bacterium]